MKREPLMAAGLALAVALAACPSAAQTPPEGIVWLALNDINAQRVHVDDPTAHPSLATEPPPGMISAVDLSPDGRPDWLIDYEATGEARWCGTGGCRKRLYVSHGDGYVRAFDRAAFELELHDHDGERRLEAQVQKLECPGDRDACLYAWAWNAATGELVERPARDGVALLAGGGTLPVDPEPGRAPADLPEPLASRWRDSVALCPSAGGGFYRLGMEASSIADIDGDGVRDWVAFDPPACAGQPDRDQPGFTLWVSRSGGHAVEVYRAPADGQLVLDIGAAPATPRLAGPCEPRTPCPGRPLRRDPASGRFLDPAA